MTMWRTRMLSIPTEQPAQAAGIERVIAGLRAAFESEGGSA